MSHSRRLLRAALTAFVRAVTRNHAVPGERWDRDARVGVVDSEGSKFGNDFGFRRALEEAVHPHVVDGPELAAEGHRRHRRVVQ